MIIFFHVLVVANDLCFILFLFSYRNRQNRLDELFDIYDFVALISNISVYVVLLKQKLDGR